MPSSSAFETIGLEYEINLQKLAASIKASKSMLGKFNRDIAAGSKQVAHAFDMVTKASNEMSTSVKKTGKGTQSATQQLKKMGVTSRTTEKELKRLKLSTLEYKKVARLLKQEMTELDQATGRNNKQLVDASVKYNRFGKLLTFTNFQVRKQVGAMGDSQRAMERWSATGLKAMALSQLAWLTMGSAIFGTIGAITVALSDITKLHQALKTLQAITQASAVEMKSMETAIRNAAVGTKFFAADMTEAAVLMAQAGFTAQEVADSIGAVAVLASATGKELKDVADLMTSIIRAYSLNASEALRVVNVLAAGISESKLQIDTLTTAMNFMGVAAHQFNISIESTVAWLGILRDRGLKASTIGTSFRGVLATLVRETDKFKEVLASLPEPLGFADITIRNGRKLEDVMERLQKAGFDVADAFMALPRRTAMTFSLMVQNTKAFRELREEITGTNRAIEMNEISMQGLQSQLAQTKSIFDDFVASMTKSGTTLEPIIRGLKLIVQTIASSILLITASLEAAGTAVGQILTVVSRIRSTKISFDREGEPIDPILGFRVPRLKINFKDVFPEDFQRQAKKEMDDIFIELQKSINRIIGKEGLFGDNVFLSQEQIADKDAQKTLVELNNEATKLKKEMAGIEEDTPEWMLKRDQLIIVNAMMKELEETAFGVAAALGPLKTLDSILISLATSGELTEEKLVSAFSKSKEDVGLLNRGVQVLRAELTKTLSDLKIDPSPELRKRAIEQAKALAEAQKELGRLQKRNDQDRIRGARELARELTARLRVASKNKNDARKGLRDEELQVERLANQRERLEERAAKKRFSLSKQLKKLVLSEFEFKKFLIKAEAEERRREVDKQVADAERLQRKLAILAIDNPLLRPQLERIKATIVLLKSRLPGIGQLEQEELKAIGAVGDPVVALKTGIKQFRMELENEQQTLVELSKETARNMMQGFEELFFKSMIGELKTLGDAWGVFSKSIQREIAQMASKWVTFGLLGTGEDDNIGLIERGFNIISGLFSHTGGLITASASGLKRMHTGGLNSNEQVRIVKTNEFVLRDQATRSIGVSTLDHMNRTGQVPVPAPVVNNNYRTFIQAMDVQSFDKLLRERGASAIHDISLGSFAIGRRRRDPRTI